MSETIGFLLNDSARLFRRAFNARTRDSGITALQWRLITYLKRHEGIRQGPLAELIESYKLPYNVGELIASENYQQIVDIQRIIQRIRDDEDEELLLLLA